MTDRDPILIIAARRGPSGDLDTGSLDWSIIRAEVDALLARADITSLDDVPDVVLTSPTTGQVLMRDASGNWVNATPASAVAGVADSDSVDLTLLSGVISAEVKYAGTGTADTASHSDHWHTNPPPVREPFGPQAYMSSGTRNLGSTSVVLPNGIPCVVKSKINMQMRGADPGACYYQLRLTINGNVRTSNGGSTGYWCVQGVPDKTTWEHHITLTGAGTAITISADVLYHSGGGFYTDSGEIVVEVDPDR